MSKQSKHHEQLRQTQANTFSDGLNMDLHPLTTPNTILTDCVNGTMITYNDNEFVLQNDRGNTKIPDAQLSKGFIPVGMKEHNGILYIVSYNPDSKATEIGTYPSPSVQSHYKGQIYEGEKQSDLIFLYSDQNQAITYYDYNLAVSNYDKYVLELTSNENPLFVLEHYILDDKGKTHKVELKPSEDGVRFTHHGSGILGYKYRPYYINSFETWVTPVSGSNFAKLNLKFSSIDQELKSVYINNENDDLTLRCLIHVVLEGFNENEFINDIVNFDTIHTFDKSSISTFYDLEGSLTKTLDFSKLYDEDLKYDYVNGVLIDEATGTKYTNFVITSTFHICKDNYRIEMNNLTQTIEVPVRDICVRPQYFDIFRYKKNDDNTLFVEAILNMEKFDVNWNENSRYSVGEASYKLLKLDDNGNIEGKKIFTAKLSPELSPEALAKIKSYNVIESDSTVVPGIGDLKALEINGDNVYHFVPKTALADTEDNAKPLSVGSKGEIETCNTVTENNNIKKVVYVKKTDGTYNVLLLNDSYKVEQAILMDPTSICDSINDMVQEIWIDENKFLQFTISDLEYESNSVYLLQLTFPIDGISNIASFFVVTTGKMLTEDNYKLDRMDQLHITDWYDVPSQNWIASYSDPVVITNNTYYTKTNTIPIEDIKNCTSEEEVRQLAKNKFWKYQQVLEKSKMWDEIPSVSSTCNASITIKGGDTFKYIVDVNSDIISFNSIGEAKVNIPLYKKWSLEGNAIDENAVQTSERQYLYDLFEDDVWQISNIKPENVYYEAASENDRHHVRNYYRFISPMNGNYLISYEDYLLNDISSGNIEIYNWVNQNGELKKETQRINKRKGKCWTLIDLVGVKTKDCYKISGEGGNGMTLALMNTVGVKNGMYYGKIQESDRIKYSGNKNKIWMHGKTSGIKHYILLGMNLLSDGEAATKLAWENIKKHGYILKEVNKPVISYNYTTDDSSMKIVESDNISNSVSVYYKIYPSLCNAIYNNYDSYNIQSWNNINFNLIKYSSQPDNFSLNDPGLSLDYSDKIKIYLSELGKLINITNVLLPINESVTPNKNSVYFDFQNSVDYDMNFPTTQFPTPEGLFWDKTNEILYNSVGDNMDSFYYVDRDCVPEFNWNYSEDFCWDVNSTTLQEIDKYNDLWFYKLTNYEVSNESE